MADTKRLVFLDHLRAFVVILVIVLHGSMSYMAYAPSSPDAPIAVQAVTALLFSVFCMSSLFAGVAVFREWVNGPGRLWSSLAANSYGMYYVHPLILYPLAYVFVAVTLPLFLKAFLVISLAILLSWALSAFVLKKAPLLRRIF